MKRFIALSFVFVFIIVISANARDHRGNTGDAGNNNGNQNQAAGQSNQQDQTNKQDQANKQNQQNQANKQSQAYKPVVINMNHPTSGWHNRNFPAQQPAQKPVQQPVKQPAQQHLQQPVQHQAQQQVFQKPSYGKLNWQQNNKQVYKPNYQPQKQPNKAAVLPGSAGKGMQSFGVNNQHSSGVNTTHAVHHHPYEQNYVRKKLQKLGVKSAPGYILDRADVINTDRGHSVIDYPKTGFNMQAMSSKPFSSRHFNDKFVSSRMGMVNSMDWQGRIQGFNRSENRAKHYYWHHEKDFDFCHFIDDLGYQWYGWYGGSSFFWTRNFSGRWWWYDTDFDRWCFWNDGFWWWQDPYHMGDIYFYNNSTYIPANSAEDQVGVSIPADVSQQAYTSTDGTRTVKVVTETQDAYLYDTANPPAFNPVYLASGVKDVQFSDTTNGRPLQIVLKLNDNSFDVFDGQGNPYGPGTVNPDQENPGKQE
jgi:hypothetical protein